MSKRILILCVVVLTAAFLHQYTSCAQLGSGQEEIHDVPILDAKKNELSTTDVVLEKDNAKIDTTYEWDKQILDWVMVKPGARAQRGAFAAYGSLSEPIELDWKVLLDIEYKLRYFSEFDMEMFAPVFPQSVMALDGKEVIIEGFVIPFDEREEVLSLSFNPYASCFFCGKASPASVISMFMENKRKRYKMDDFKRFRGNLYLNHDDPDEFYYVLKNAKEE